MGTFEDLLNKAKDAAEMAGKKTGEFIDITKVKMEISRLEKELTVIYEGLGRLAYDAKKGAEDRTELMDTCVSKIDELTVQLNLQQDKLAQMKNVVRCASCGTLNEQDASFCKSCGEQL